MRLLLASKSSARRAMLESAGVPFEVVEARIDEESAKIRFRDDGLPASSLASVLAVAKASSVRAHSEDLVLGSDQTLELPDGRTLDKPDSREEAAQHLRALSGRMHRLHSAAAVVEEGHVVWQHCETVELRMRGLSDSFIDRYLDSEYEAIRWSVGGYRIEGRGAQLFEEVRGSHFAVLGMPLLPLLAFLRERGLIPA